MEGVVYSIFGNITVSIVVIEPLQLLISIIPFPVFLFLQLLLLFVGELFIILHGCSLLLPVLSFLLGARCLSILTTRDVIFIIGGMFLFNFDQRRHMSYIKGVS